MTQVWAPRQASRIDRRVRRLDRLGRVTQGAVARLVGADLVAGRAVGVERERHRRRAPVAVVAVVRSSPSSGPCSGAPSGTPSDVSASPRTASVIWTPAGEHHVSLISEAKTALGLLHDVDVDRLADGRRGRRRGRLGGRRRRGRRVERAAGVGTGVGVGVASDRAPPPRRARSPGRCSAPAGPAAVPRGSGRSRPSRWSNLSPAPKALTATALEPMARPEQDDRSPRRR